MALILPFRPNKLAYPGTGPGINYAHPAAQGLSSSVVPICGSPSVNGQYTDLLGNPVTLTSTGNKSFNTLDGLLGSCIFNSAGGNVYAVQMAEGPSSATYAAIWRSFNVGTSYRGIINFSSFNGIYVLNNVLELWNSGDVAPTSAIPITPFNAYFIAISCGAGGTNYIARNLNTGQTRTGVNSHTYIQGGGTKIYYGDDNSGDASLGYLAAAMCSKTFLSIPQLLQWAEDPWSFWYPQNFDLAQTIKSFGAAGRGLFINSQLTGLGAGGSFFPDRLAS